MFNAKSLERLAGVHPDIRAVAKRAAQISQVEFQVPQFGGYRTEAEQRALVERGVSKTMNSNHRKGLAVDVLPYIDGVDAWTYDNQHGEGSSAPAFRTVNTAMMSAAAELGAIPLQWGFAMWGWDMPHHQLDPARYPAGLNSPSLIDAHNPSRFSKVVELVLDTEGGWNSADPSNRGITLNTLSLYLGRPASMQELEDLSESQARNIYQTLYWSPIRGDAFRPGPDYALFDFAVHSGPPRAAMELQEVVGADPDGVIGPLTLAAVRAMPAADVIDGLMDRRLAYMKTRDNWEANAKGWTARVKRVREEALGMVKETPAPPPVPPLPPIPPEEAMAVEAITKLIKRNYGAKSVLIEW